MKSNCSKTGLRRIDDIVAQLNAEADSLSHAVDHARALLLGAVGKEGNP